MKKIAILLLTTLSACGQPYESWTPENVNRRYAAIYGTEEERDKRIAATQAGIAETCMASAYACQQLGIALKMQQLDQQYPSRTTVVVGATPPIRYVRPVFAKEGQWITPDYRTIK